MAIAENTIHARPSSVFAAVSGWFTTLIENRRRHAIYRQTLRELSALTERELNDIGLSRAQVETVSMQAACMAR